MEENDIYVYGYENNQTCENCKNFMKPNIESKRCGETGYRETCYIVSCSICSYIIFDDTY